jgi:hypothetical protein
MSRPLAILVALAALGACARDSAPSRVLDARRERFVEDEAGGRTLAALDVELVRDGGRARLSLVAHAEGPEVDPVPGLAGVRGANRITARELDRIASGRLLEVRTRRLDLDGAAIEGEYRVVRRGGVPERRVLADGRIDVAAKTEELALALGVDGGAVDPGRFATELTLGGRVRLSVEFRFDGERGAIERAEIHPAAEAIGP